MTVEKSKIIQRTLFAWFWVMVCTGFVCEEILFPLKSLTNTIFLLCDAVLMVLGLWTIRHRFDWFILLSYGAISFWSTCYVNHSSIIIWLNGSRDMFGILFMCPILRFFWDDLSRREKFVKMLDKHLYVFLVVQVICVPYQYFKYGAGDHVGGSMGDGFSGVLTLSVFLISFYLLHKHINKEHFVTSIVKNWVYLFFLFPTFLNETKVSFVLLIIYFLLLIPIDRKLFFRILIALPVTVLILGVFMTVYNSVSKDNSELNRDVLDMEFLSEYMWVDFDEAEGQASWALNDQGITPDIPRLTKIAFMFVIMEDNPDRLWSGFGMGMNKGGTTLAVTEFAQEYDWLVEGTTVTVFSVFMQLGIVGSVWAIVFFCSLFFRRPPQSPVRDTNLQLFVLSLILLLLVYADFWRVSQFCFLCFAAIYLSWNVGEEDSTKMLTEPQTVKM